MGELVAKGAARLTSIVRQSSLVTASLEVLVIALVSVVVLSRESSAWWELVGAILFGLVGVVLVDLGLRGRAVMSSAGYLAPHELPPAPSIFVGREKELHDATRYLAGAVLGPGRSPRIVIIRGLPGIGKTSLALKLAHAVGDGYPDGQLVANVGIRKDQDQVTRVAELREYLIQAFVGAQDRGRARRLHIDQLGRIVRRRRVLYLFDDAASMDVVRPLLPREHRCGVIVTTSDPRARLSDHDHIIDLDTLTSGEAMSVLRGIAGNDRVNAEEQHAQEIVEVTKRHPLSVVTAAAGLAERPYGRLDFALGRLRQYRGDGAQTSPTNTLDLSFALLSTAERKAMSTLVVMTHTFSPWELAALIETDDTAATRIADRLSSVGLLERTSTDSVGLPEYVIPGPVHDYIMARSTEADRKEFQQKLSLRSQERYAIPGDELRRQVLRRLEEGRPVEAIKAARDAVAKARDTDNAVAEGLALAAFAEVRAELGNFESAEDLATTALAVPLAEAWARRTLGRRHRRLHQTDDAVKQLMIARERSSGAEHVRVLWELAVTHAQGQSGDLVAAEKALAQAQRLSGSTRYRYLHAGIHLAWSYLLEKQGHLDRSAEAVDAGRVAALAEKQLLWLAWLMYREAELCMARQRYDLARQRALQAIEDFATMNHRYGKAHCRLLVGQSFLRQGRPKQARPLLEDSVENFINCGDRWAEAEAMRLLADTYDTESEQDVNEKNRLLKASSLIFRDLGDADSHRKASPESWLAAVLLPHEQVG